MSNNIAITYPETETAINENTLNIGCFVVPNGPMDFDWMKEHYTPKFVDMMRKDTYGPLDTLGIPHKEDEKYIEVWFYADGHDNLTDHGYGKELSEFLGLEYNARYSTCNKLSAPHHLPYNILKDVKEGDVKTFTTKNGKTVKITFQQKGHRYSNLGNFEDLVQQIAVG